MSAVLNGIAEGRRDIVAPPQLTWVHAQFRGGQIDHAFDHERGLSRPLPRYGRIGLVLLKTAVMSTCIAGVR